MLVHLNTPLRRLVVVVVSTLVAVWLSYFGVRAAIASYEAGKSDAVGLQNAVHLEPGNPEYWYYLGQYQLSNLDQPSPSLVRNYLQKAIELNPVATEAWLGFGILEETEGNVEEARKAYIQAKKSYPTSAQVHWQYGNFLLRQGEQPEAFVELRHAIQADPHLATQAFTRVFRIGPDIDAILANVLPATQSVYVDVIAEAVREKQLAVAKIIWARLMTLHPILTIRDFNPLVAELGIAGELTEARQTWDQGVATMGLPPLIEPKGTVVWDPSFESNIRGYSFSWYYEPIAQGVSIALDRSEKHSGSQSLHFAFDGKHNPNLEGACAIGAVLSNTTYRLSGWVKTKEITTNYGVALRLRAVEDRQLRDVITRELHGTNPWILLEQTWRSGPYTRTAQICVIREPSDDPEVRISGNAWVDDVNLIPQSTQHQAK